MPNISVPVRYYHQPRTAYVTEADFQLKTLEWDLDVSQIALILVDVWSDHYVSTHLERGRDITVNRIRPLTDAFRRMGGTVIHAPSPDCARKYPRWTNFAGDGEFGKSSPKSKDEWPPSEFLNKTGRFEKWARPTIPDQEKFNLILKNRRIIPEVEPEDNDDVILTGNQLHRLLSYRKILHLFYAGFAANMCIPFRDYGMRAMKARGYDVTLIRDCTTAIEVDETAQDLSITRHAVIDTELTVGYSVSSKELVEACVNIDP